MTRLTSEWIVRLPAGNYTIRDLMKITGITARPIARQMMRHGAKVTKRLIRPNLFENVYEWEGYRER